MIVLIMQKDVKNVSSLPRCSMCHQMSLMHGYLEDGQWILLGKYTHLRQMDITNRLKLFFINRLIKKQCSNSLKNISFTGLNF